MDAAGRRFGFNKAPTFVKASLDRGLLGWGEDEEDFSIFLIRLIRVIRG
jgi:hypothetical protein